MIYTFDISAGDYSFRCERGDKVIRVLYSNGIIKDTIESDVEIYDFTAMSLEVENYLNNLE